MLVIIGGVIIALWPSINPNGNKIDVGPVFWNVIFLLGSVPVAVAYVYQEKALGDQPIHMASMLAWSTLYQFVTILICFPLDVIPHFGTATSFSEALQ